ncbi:MAG: rhamnogalacturonan lyase, partial [Prevotella sp.]|nr:rhamnogalacturonan lyase [Prevotella sp.]
MKKLKIYIASALLVLAAVAVQAQNTPVSQMEKLDRGLVALPNSSGSGNFVSWRYLGTDDPVRTTFNLKRNGIVIKEKLVVTNYKDTGGNNSSQYSVETVVDGKVVETSAPVKAWDKVWLKLPLNRPAGGSTESGAYTYSPNDCSVGDVDGDGKYELFVKWDPSNSKDNSQDGYTGNVIIDCYKLDGTLLWRIDLGRNIRAGAHYTQFMVYDFDGDGKAEMMCKTAPGSKDAAGNYVNQATDNTTIKNASNTKVWLSSSGRMDGGHEYLTVFNGETGAAIHTIAYNPNRNTKSELSEAQGTFNWAVGKTDTHGYNRGDRYLAAVAYLDGPDGNASGIFCRGYYTYAYIWAVDFDGEKLIPRWLHRSDANNQYSVVTYDKQGTGTTKNYTPSAATSGSGSRTMFGNGNHNLSVGDVDGDGCDEIIWGSAGLDNDGKLLYATGFGHGDAIHMGKMIPGRDGMQVFEVHEEKGTYAWDLHDAATGEVLHKGGPEGVDNGRGMAAQLTNKSAEWWFSSNSAREQRSAVTGETASEKSGSLNFRVYWDGTVQDALLDGNKIDKYNSSSNSFSRLVTFSDLGGPSSTCNSTKNTPNLSADILGDWREEVLLYTVTDEETYLGIYTTNIATDYRIPTLMHDHTYRMGICWQNTAYNQPPHIGYNLVEATQTHLVVDKDINAEVNEPVEFLIAGDFVQSISVVRGFAPDGTSKRSCPV